MDPFMTFCYVIAAIGFLMVVASFALIFYKRIIGEVVVHGPNGMKFKTNMPLVFSLFIGALLVAYSLHELREDRKNKHSFPPADAPRTISLVCKYTGAEKLWVYATLGRDQISHGVARIRIPVLKDALYEAMCFKENSSEPYARQSIMLESNKDEFVWNVLPPPETEDQAAKSNLPTIQIDPNAKNYAPSRPAGGNGSQ